MYTHIKAIIMIVMISKTKKLFYLPLGWTNTTVTGAFNKLSQHTSLPPPPIFFFFFFFLWRVPQHVRVTRVAVRRNAVTAWTAARPEPYLHTRLVELRVVFLQPKRVTENRTNNTVVSLPGASRFGGKPTEIFLCWGRFRGQRAFEGGLRKARGGVKGESLGVIKRCKVVLIERKPCVVAQRASSELDARNG